MQALASSPRGGGHHERLFRIANEIYQTLGVGEHMGGLERVGTAADAVYCGRDRRSAAIPRLCAIRHPLGRAGCGLRAGLGNRASTVRTGR